MIRKLRSHNDVQSTACLAHLARDSVKTASDQNSGSLAANTNSAPNGGGTAWAG